MVIHRNYQVVRIDRLIQITNCENNFTRPPKLDSLGIFFNLSKKAFMHKPKKSPTLALFPPCWNQFRQKKYILTMLHCYPRTKNLYRMQKRYILGICEENILLSNFRDVILNNTDVFLRYCH